MNGIVGLGILVELLVVAALAAFLYFLRRASLPTVSIISRFVRRLEQGELPQGYGWARYSYDITKSRTLPLGVAGADRQANVDPPDAYNHPRLRLWLQNLDSAPIANVGLVLSSHTNCTIHAVHAVGGANEFDVQVLRGSERLPKGIDAAESDWVVVCSKGMRGHATWRVEVYLDGVPSIEARMFSYTVGLGTKNVAKRFGPSVGVWSFLTITGLPVGVAVAVLAQADPALELGNPWLMSGYALALVAALGWAFVMYVTVAPRQAGVLSGWGTIGRGRFLAQKADKLSGKEEITADAPQDWPRFPPT